MNLFGTFAYGNIIKTFIPGIFLVFGIGMLFDCISFWVNQEYTILEYCAAHPILTIGLIIPVSVFTGILSNSICFSWLTPSFIKEPYDAKNKEFLTYENQLTEEVKDRYSEILDIPENLKAGFKKYTDINSLLLVRENLNTLQYLKESYWYYLEFQVNSILAISLLASTGISHILLRYNAGLVLPASVFPYIVLILVIYILMVRLFWKSAQKNYDRHRKKSFSYFLGAHHVCRHASEMMIKDVREEK